jgi:hypothetical protein
MILFRQTHPIHIVGVIAADGVDHPLTLPTNDPMSIDVSTG